MRTRWVVTVLVLLGLVAGVGYWLGNWWSGPASPLRALGPECLVEVAGDGTVGLDQEQVANAATVTAVAARLEMPDRAAVVALATALQESKLRNLPDLGRRNDHDSIGLFQQRPSQGWGSAEELANPRFASERFYQALRKVDGWEGMRVTEAAQRVQRSAFPEAYDKWRDDANVLATALLGQAAGAVTCRAASVEGSDLPGPEALGAALAADWGDRTEVAAADPPGVTVRAEDAQMGWRYAHWLVAYAETHGVARVQFADRVWTAADGTWSLTEPVLDHVLAELSPSTQ